MLGAETPGSLLFALRLADADVIDDFGTAAADDDGLEGTAGLAPSNGLMTPPPPAGAGRTADTSLSSYFLSLRKAFSPRRTAAVPGPHPLRPQ